MAKEKHPAINKICLRVISMKKTGMIRHRGGEYCKLIRHNQQCQRRAAFGLVLCSLEGCNG
jgi:hypothetical protein